MHHRQVLQKVSKTVESGAFYEAQQMYKTIYHRYKARKQLEDSYQILKVCCAPAMYHASHAPACQQSPGPMARVQGGAIQQLHSNQVTCGVELGLLLVEVSAHFTPAHNRSSMCCALQCTMNRS